MDQNKKTNTSVIVPLIIIALIVVGIVYALMNKKSESVVEQDTVNTINNANNTEVKEKVASTNTKPMEPNQQSNSKMLANFTPLSNTATLVKQDLVVGTGAEVQAGATVSVHYTGAVAATGAIFQSSKDFGPNPVTFPLSGVIKGWTDGIPGMKVGGIRRLVIPAAQAYGANPPQGSGIPANADLVFDVELVGIK